MFNKIKQLREMQKQAKEVQKTLADEVITVEEGNITIKINGNMEVESIDISDMGDKDTLERELKNAMNSAVKKSQKLMAEKMMSSGMSLPGM